MSSNQDTAHPAKPAPAVAASRRRPALIAVAGVTLLAGLGYGAWWAFALRHHEATDNAYVQAPVVQIPPQVGGTDPLPVPHQPRFPGAAMERVVTHRDHHPGPIPRHRRSPTTRRMVTDHRPQRIRTPLLRGEDRSQPITRLQHVAALRLHISTDTRDPRLRIQQRQTAPERDRPSPIMRERQRPPRLSRLRLALQPTLLRLLRHVRVRGHLTQDLPRHPRQMPGVEPARQLHQPLRRLAPLRRVQLDRKLVQHADDRARLP